MTRLLPFFALAIAAALPAVAVPGRWRDNGDKTLTDTQNDLVWTAYESRGNFDWPGAKQYCSELGLADGKWRLPEVDELEGLYTDGRGGTVDCMPAEWDASKLPYRDCKVSPMFHLTTFWFWSATPAGTGEAWYVALGNGHRYSGSVLDPSYTRVLCVRSAIVNLRRS